MRVRVCEDEGVMEQLGMVSCCEGEGVKWCAVSGGGSGQPSRGGAARHAQ